MTEPTVASLVQHASQRLRHDILDGVIPPGHKLKVEALSGAYRISSTPVREALNRLTQEGLVISDTRRGFRVAAMSCEDLHDIIRLRVLVEGDALVESMRYGSADWEESLSMAYRALEKAAIAMDEEPGKDREEWSNAHRRFHMATLSACRSTRQLEICKALFDQAERYRRLSARERAIPRDRTREHRELFEAVVGRQVDKALVLNRRHLEATRDAIGSNIDWDSLAF